MQTNAGHKIIAIKALRNYDYVYGKSVWHVKINVIIEGNSHSFGEKDVNFNVALNKACNRADEKTSQKTGYDAEAQGISEELGKIQVDKDIWEWVK